MSRIKIENVTKKFDDTLVLKNIDLEVAEGEMVSLVGPSGSGKTTILRLLAGLIQPSEGRVFIDGKNTSHMTSKERGAIIVFQEYALFPHMTVIENIAFGLKVRSVPKEVRKKKAIELVSLLHMEGMETRYPRELSGGQKQRVAIARALAIEPNVLLLDEPFSSLDTHLRHSMRELISELQKNIGITTILVTHDTEEALMISDRVAVLMDGEVIQFDEPRALYRKPINKRTADFFGDNNSIPCDLKEGLIDLPLVRREVQTHYSGPATVVFRREALFMHPESHTGWKGQVKESIYSGKSVLYKIETDLGSVQVAEDSKSEWKVGQMVSLELPESEVLVYRNDTGELI